MDIATLFLLFKNQTVWLLCVVFKSTNERVALEACFSMIAPGYNPLSSHSNEEKGNILNLICCM